MLKDVKKPPKTAVAFLGLLSELQENREQSNGDPTFDGSSTVHFALFNFDTVFFSLCLSLY